MMRTRVLWRSVAVALGACAVVVACSGLQNASGAAGASSATAPALRSDEMAVVLLIGQSNMAGRGIVEAQDTVPIPGVFSLSRDSVWVPARDPMHWDRPDIAGVGLGRAFARALVDARPGARVGLVPAAVGGSSLYQWRVGGPLYTTALARLRVAQRSGRLVAILWHQGESDSNTPDSAATYAARWRTVMAQLRADAGEPNVPIVAGELAPFLTQRYAPVVNEQIRTLPHVLDGVGVVSARGLNHKGDSLHFDAASLRAFGRRYAEGYFTLAPGWRR